MNVYFNLQEGKVFVAFNKEASIVVAYLRSSALVDADDNNFIIVLF